MTTVGKTFTDRGEQIKLISPVRVRTQICFARGRGKELKLCHIGHIPTENRNGLIVETEVTEAVMGQEWDVDTTMLVNQGARSGRTVGADKDYDTLEFLEGNRGLGITTHVATKSLRSCIGRRTTNTDGYKTSQVKKNRIEECFD